MVRRLLKAAIVEVPSPHLSQFHQPVQSVIIQTGSAVVTTPRRGWHVGEKQCEEQQQEAVVRPMLLAFASPSTHVIMHEYVYTVP